MNPIFAFVGPSGAGKSTLILELIKQYPERIKIIKTRTSRKRRGPEDDLFYSFVTRDDIQRLWREGKLVQYLEYSGNYYGCAREDVDSVLQTKFGIQAFVEDGVRDFRKAGYTMIVIKVHPEHNTPDSSDEKRRTEDEARAKSGLQADFELANSFLPGGKEKAMEELMKFVETVLMTH